MSIAFLGCFTLGIQSLAEGNTTYLLNNTTPLPANGGQAMCFTGIIPLIVTSNNTRLNYAEPTDQFLLTQTVVEVLQANSPLPASLDPKPNIITGTYNIFGKLCLPSAPNGSFSAVQILTHGGMLNSTYWDIAPDYSYVSAAAAAGYATFSYDRIGTGLSDHPDPIQVVQLALSVEILHKFISLLRNGALGGHAFERVVGVGHSVGSAVTQAVTTLYPDDLDAVALTGYSTTPNSSLVTLASFDLIPANADPNGRFKDLPNAYVLQSTSQSLQFAFYHYPNFDASSRSSFPSLSLSLSAWPLLAHRTHPDRRDYEVIQRLIKYLLGMQSSNLNTNIAT